MEHYKEYYTKAVNYGNEIPVTKTSFYYLEGLRQPPVKKKIYALLPCKSVCCPQLSPRLKIAAKACEIQFY